MRVFILILSLTIFSFSSFSQDNKVKPGCSKPKESCSIKDKKACSPGGTKVAEAKVLTDLRKELSEVKSTMGYSESIEMGEDDDESLQIMLSSINDLLRQEGHQEVKPGKSKAKTVATIRKKIASLQKR